MSIESLTYSPCMEPTTCWEVHRPGEDASVYEGPHYISAEKAVEALTADPHWASVRDSHPVLCLVELDFRCWHACCTGCGEPAGDDYYHYPNWERVVGAVESAGLDETGRWRIDHTEQTLWCPSCQTN